MALTLGNEVYKDGEEVDYYSLSGYTHSRFQGIKMDIRDIINASSGMFKGKLQFNQGGWTSKAGWILKNSSGKFHHDFNTEVNTLNDKPFDKNKRSNILLLKKGYITQYLANVMPQAPVTVDQVEATPIPCSQTPINLNDKVKYGDKEGIVTGFEITYKDQTTQTVRCDDKLFSITAGIEKNKSDSFTKRNPGVVYAHVVAGKRTRRKRKNRKTRYGLETRS